jgi:hypothetical protein
MSRFSELVAKMALEFPFELDTFQKEAIYHLENNESVFIAAHTSAGKVPISCSLSIYPSQSFLFGDLFSRIAFFFHSERVCRQWWQNTRLPSPRST